MELTITIATAAPSNPVTHPLVRADSPTTALFWAEPVSAGVSLPRRGSKSGSGNAPR